MMDANRWKLIERIYEAVRELSEKERDAYLDVHYGDDKAVVAEVHKLFNQKDEAVNFFEAFRGDIFSSIDDPVEEPAPAYADPLVGTQVAHYHIEEKVGSGGMGVVYKALDIKLQRNVALKVLNTELNSNEEARARFMTEAKAASALSHPNVATVYAVEDILDNRLAIAMTFCEGKSLKDRMKKEGLPEIVDAVNIGLQIAKGLHAAHEKGIVHRDIKPGNIMLDKGGNVSLVDFGLARVMGETKITKTGSTMGTVAYMAPEQAKGGKAGHQADIWSFGVVLFEMLTGQMPFYGEHLHSMLYAVINEQPIPISGLRPGIPSQLEHVVSRALSKELKQRYDNFGHVISDLQAVLDGKELFEPEVVAEEPAAVEVAPVEGANEPVKILVVDDEPDIELLLRQQYYKKIRAGEWELIFAENGADALKKIDEMPSIHLVLTDIQMPEMDGLTLLSKLRERKRLIRTIVVSAYGDMKNIRKAMNQGAYDFLTKPIQFPDLERTIYKTIDNINELQQAHSLQRRLLNLENELTLARRIQQQVLPKRLPESDELSVYAYMEPAQEVNSDFYDFFYLDDERLGFFIGDVSGKGFSASLFMAMSRTLLKADAQRGVSPAACMNALNRFLYPEKTEGIFITVFYGILDIKSGQLTYCNAGHLPPWVLRESGDVEKLPWTGGIGIGVKKEFVYEDATVVLDKNDGMLLLTDGLLKRINPERELFSEEHLSNVLKEQATASPSQIIRHIVRAVSTFSLGEQQSDDNTLLAIRRTMGS